MIQRRDHVSQGTKEAVGPVDHENVKASAVSVLKKAVKFRGVSPPSIPHCGARRFQPLTPGVLQWPLPLTP